MKKGEGEVRLVLFSVAVQPGVRVLAEANRTLLDTKDILDMGNIARAHECGEFVFVLASTWIVEL